MTEKLQEILQEIESGKRKYIYDLNLTREDLLTKDANGIYFIEYLLKNKISLLSLKDKIEDDAEIIYLFCKHKQSLYMFNFNEEQLFSTINDKRLIEYIIEKVPQVVEYLRNISPMWEKLMKGEMEHVI